MLTIYFYTIISVIIVSLVSFVGALYLALKAERLKKITLYLVSLSAGSLLGGALLHLLPEIIKEKGSEEFIWLSVLAGILLFYLLEKIVCWRHCHIPTSDHHPHPLAIMNLVGDGLHNFLDGVVIAGSFLVSPALGVATTIAVVAHEIPQEMADFGVLIHAGYSRAKAILFNFLISLTAIAGALFTLLLGGLTENLTAYIIPFTAGGFIYIATADLIPELRKDTSSYKSVIQFFFILVGVGIMMLLKMIW